MAIGHRANVSTAADLLRSSGGNAARSIGRRCLQQPRAIAAVTSSAGRSAAGGLDVAKQKGATMTGIHFSALSLSRLSLDSAIYCLFRSGFRT